MEGELVGQSGPQDRGHEKDSQHPVNGKDAVAARRHERLRRLLHRPPTSRYGSVRKEALSVYVYVYIRRHRRSASGSGIYLGRVWGREDAHKDIQGKLGYSRGVHPSHRVVTRLTLLYRFRVSLDTRHPKPNWATTRQRAATSYKVKRTDVRGVSVTQRQRGAASARRSKAG